MSTILEGFASLFQDVNRADGGEETQQGPITPFLPELELSMDDAELLKLKNQWMSAWGVHASKLERRQKQNEKYWLGRPDVLRNWWGEDRAQADNVMFEALETLLPLATRKNPEPTVQGSNDPKVQEMADQVRKMLIFLADSLRLKLIMKRGVRYWSLYLLGAWKVGWSYMEDQMVVQAIRPQKLILDPHGTITDALEYTGNYIGEYREDTADVLKERFPSKKKFIDDMVSNQEGTRIAYIEWWTPKYTFYSCQNEILGKYKNPHWNYDGKKQTVDEFGNEVEKEVRGSNHFHAPKMPYVFLSVFNLGKKPYDETSLFEQTLSLQDMVNKRIYQIDRNADNTNAGLKVSGDHFTEEQASRVDRALRKGNSIFVPRGDVNSAVAREVGPSLPPFVYQSLQDYRARALSIFGVQGSTPTGIAGQDTVRGKILAKTSDDSRIGGGIVEYIEQAYDQLFNWMVQIMYVYYDETHIGSIIGEEGARDYTQLRSSDLQNVNLMVSVKEGSLIPEDPLTKANQAVDLWGAGAIDPITLMKRLGDPNPYETAKSLFMWQKNPESLFPEVAQEMQAQQPQQEAPQAGAPQMGIPEEPSEVPVPIEEPQALSQNLMSSVPIQ